MQELRESTTITLNVGPFVDKGDGVTNESGLSPTAKVSKNGAALAARNSATAIAYDADGYYRIELNTTDTNTLGRLTLTVTDTATHLHVKQDYMVLAAGYYDEKYVAAVTLTGGGASTATLDAGASATSSLYVGQRLILTSGTGAGQARRIISYDGGTKIATVDTAWTTQPVNGTGFRIENDSSVLTTAIERTAIADAMFDETSGVETGLTLRNALRLIAAAVAGKLSGASSGASTVIIRNAVADSKDRITASTDATGNRTSITTDLT